MTVMFVCPPVDCLMARLDGQPLPPPRTDDVESMQILIRQCEDVHIERGQKILRETPEIAAFAPDGPGLLRVDGIGADEASAGFGVSRGKPRRRLDDAAARARAAAERERREREWLSEMMLNAVHLAEVRGSTCAVDGCQRRPAHDRQSN